MNEKRLIELTDVVRDLCTVMGKAEIGTYGEIMTVIMSFVSTSACVAHSDIDRYWSELSFAVKKCWEVEDNDDGDRCIRMIPFLAENEVESFQKSVGTKHGNWSTVNQKSQNNKPDFCMSKFKTDIESV